MCKKDFGRNDRCLAVQEEKQISWADRLTDRVSQLLHCHCTNKEQRLIRREERNMSNESDSASPTSLYPMYFPRLVDASPHLCFCFAC